MNKYSQLSDEEFNKVLTQRFYKTNYQQIGGNKPIVENETKYDTKSKFTDHLFGAGMYRNASLNTVREKERWVQGSKDWMEHLG